MSIRFNKKKNRKPKASQKQHIGEIRKSQLMNTFGVGSMVDFVRDTAMIGGVDDWDRDDSAEYRKISNENLQSLTGAKYFLEPKTSDGNKYLPVNQDIRSYAFPQKLYCPVCKNIISYRELISNTNRHVCPIIKEDKGKNAAPSWLHRVLSLFAQTVISMIFLIRGGSTTVRNAPPASLLPASRCTILATEATPKA